MLFRQVVLYALLVGVLSGLLLTVVQLWNVIPIIESAERFEDVMEPTAHGDHDHDHGHFEGMQRTGYTLLSNVLIATGFAMVMLTIMVASLKTRAMSRLDWRYGLLWGAAGYIVFFLAPALGLPPEIPGAASASLEARQLWWLFAVVCTAAGLAGAVFIRSPWRWTALGLLVVPHLVGAPHPPSPMFEGHPPAVAAELEELARRFIGATAIANAALWIALGLASIWAVRRIASPSAIGLYEEQEE